MLVDDSDNVSFKSNVMFMKIWQTPKYEIFLSKKLILPNKSFRLDQDIFSLILEKMNL